MSEQETLIALASAAAVENFQKTSGSVSEGFELLRQHAPAAFAGYGLIRSDLMKDGALDLKTKELIFALLDTMLGVPEGAKTHAANAIRLGLSIEQLSEGLVQCIMAGGITTWNRAGKAAMLHALETRKSL